VLNINVNVRDIALNISRDFTIAIDEQLLIRDLTAMLVKKLAWPERDINGQQIIYILQIERNNGKIQLTGDEIIKAVGLLNGDRLTIGPVFSAAVAPTPSTSVGSVTTQEASQPYTMAPLQRE
jgi:hypothetical protein